VRREGQAVYAESFIPRLRGGQGAHLWGAAAPLFDREGRRTGAIEVIRDVTEQKGMELALRESERKYRTLFETADDAILLMREDRFVDCNPRALTLYGCGREQILGASPFALSPPVQPDGRASEEAAHERIALAISRGPQRFEWLHSRLDGTTFDADVRLNALRLDGETLLQAVVRDITERKRVEEALRTSETQLSLILNNVSDIIFAIAVGPDDDFRFTSVNRRFVEATGVAEPQVVGARARDVIPKPAHPLVFGKYREAIRTGRPARWEETSQYPAGTRVGQVTVVPVSDGHGRCTQLVGMVHDVTERRQMEEALRASEREYRELVSLANSIILRWNREGRITFLNEFGQRFFGYAEDEIVGRHVVGTIVPEHESTGRDLVALMREVTADPQHFERGINENMRRGGELVWIDWTNKVVFDEQGQIREILSIGSDITDRRRAEEEVRKLNEDLRRHAETLERRVDERTAELKEINAELEAFTYSVSHDLRAPLRQADGFAKILLEDYTATLDDTGRHYLERVREGTRFMGQLVDELLDFSRLGRRRSRSRLLTWARWSRTPWPSSSPLARAAGSSGASAAFPRWSAIPA